MSNLTANPADLSDEQLLSILSRNKPEPDLTRPPSDLSDEELLDLLGPATPAPPPEPRGESGADPLGARTSYGRNVLAPQINADAQALMGRGIVKGLGDVGRGLGLLDELTPEEKAEFDAIAKDRPDVKAGEIIGQVAPWLYPAALVSKIASLPARLLATSSIAGTEGYTVTRGQGGTKSEAAFAGAVGFGLGTISEALGPIIDRSVRALGRQFGLAPGVALLTKEGRPTPQFQKALDGAGVSFDDIQQSALVEIQKLKNLSEPEQAARLARFRSEGIEPTAGQVTQDFTQQAQEARLASMATGPEGEPIRQRFLEQSQQFEGRVDDMVASLNLSEDAGQTIKDALKGRKTLLREEKNALYKKVAEASPEVANAPILTDTIVAAIPDARTQRRIGRLAADEKGALDDLLVEFGLDESPESVEAFLKSGGEITPLTLGNFDEFRQAINQIERADKSGAIFNLTGPIKTALDEEAVLISEAVSRSGIDDVGILKTLEEARARVLEIKTEFSPQAISGKLIDTKSDRVTPIVQASQVTQKLLRPNAPIEDLRAVLNNLSKSGAKGRQAIQDLQAATILQAMDAALKAPSRKTSGVQTMSGNQFAKALDAIGDEKLSLIFKGNEETFKRLKNLRQIALDMEPTSGAVPKGSAPIILDALKRLGRVPGIAAVVDTVNFIVNAGADDRAVARALKARPELRQTASEISEAYPALAAVLGIGVLLESGEEDDV